MGCITLLLYYTEDRTTDGEITTHSDLTALLKQKQYFKKTPSIFFGLQLCGFLKKIKPKVNGNDGLASLKIFAAITKSAKTGKKIEI